MRRYRRERACQGETKQRAYTAGKKPVTVEERTNGRKSGGDERTARATMEDGDNGGRTGAGGKVDYRRTGRTRSYGS
jgi:hypothetical protein